MKDRLLAWKSSASGVAISGLLVYVFNSFECKLPSDWMVYLTTVLPTILGILSKDH